MGNAKSRSMEMLDVPTCTTYGTLEGSEDVSLWNNGIAIVSSGLLPSETQGGLMFGLDLASTEVELNQLELRDIPDFGFRPHGIYIDNSTAPERLFAISHSDMLEEEAIFVFEILDEGGKYPALHYQYTMVSESFQWNDASLIWFLNDLAIVGSNELLVTQFGPFNGEEGKHLYRCMWDENNMDIDTRVEASCEIAYDGQASTGLNGINVNADKTKVWVNDLDRARIWEFDRASDGTLKRRDDIVLPGVIDNIEYDFGSGDVSMGMIGFEFDPTFEDIQGGNIVLRSQEEVYAQPEIALLDTSARNPPYQVSVAMEYGRRTVLGSAFDTGIVVCERQNPSKSSNDFLSEESMAEGAIAGIVAACVGVVALFVGLVYAFKRRSSGGEIQEVYETMGDNV